MIQRYTKLQHDTSAVYPVASDSIRYVVRALSERRLRRHIQDIGAQWTGEKRAPKAGEWFLSRASVEAYYAPNDLTQAYPIAKLVIRDTAAPL